jgi:hypothetical protein
MKKPNIFIFIFALIGTLFSGYLTYNSMILKIYVLKEPCPFLFGYPVCIYGFVMFLLLLILSIFLLIKENKSLMRCLQFILQFRIYSLAIILNLL